MSVQRDQFVLQDKDRNAKFQFFSFQPGKVEVRNYKKRRTHTKTTSGCLACRTKRVKCDELKPVCARCHRNDRTCVYHVSKKGASDVEGPSMLSMVTVDAYASHNSQNGTPVIHLMQHFERNWIRIFNMPGRDEILELSKSHPLVRNTILAVTASHLRHMSPGILQHRIAEHFQLSLALQDCQQLMSLPPDQLGESRAYALVLSTVLLNMLAFALPESEMSSNSEPDVSESWVFSPHENRLAWLALQEGTRHLLRSIAAYLVPAMKFLGRVFLGPSEDPWAYSTFGPSLDSIPRSWSRFFRLDVTMCEMRDASEQTDISNEWDREIPQERQSDDIFRPAIAALWNSVDISSTTFGCFKNLPFLSKVHTEFRALLYLRDEKALWLFGYWLGLMSRYEGLWWCDKRVQRDYKAIRMWLDQSHVTSRSGAEGEIWREMMDEFDQVALASITFKNSLTR